MATENSNVQVAFGVYEADRTLVAEIYPPASVSEDAVDRLRSLQSKPEVTTHKPGRVQRVTVKESKLPTPYDARQRFFKVLVTGLLRNVEGVSVNLDTQMLNDPDESLFGTRSVSN